MLLRKRLDRTSSPSSSINPSQCIWWSSIAFVPLTPLGVLRIGFLPRFANKKPLLLVSFLICLYRCLAGGFALTPGVLPVARDAAYCERNSVIYRHGGYNESEPFSPDLWAVQAVGPPLLLPATGMVPSGRTGHVIAPAGDQFILLFGGRTPTGYSNEIFAYDVVENTWLKGYSSNGREGPLPRAFHAMATKGNGKFYFAGGSGADGKAFSDLWLLNTVIKSGPITAETFLYEWVKLFTAPKIPDRRYGHFGLALVDDDLYFVGNVDTENPSPECTIDIFNTKNRLWRTQPMKNCMSPVRDAAVTSFGRHIYAVGGCWTREELGEICESHAYELQRPDLSLAVTSAQPDKVLEEEWEGWIKLPAKPISSASGGGTGGGSGVGVKIIPKMKFGIAKIPGALFTIDGHIGHLQEEDYQLDVCREEQLIELASECDSTYCVNDGQCRPPGTDLSCQCPSGFEGVDCAEESLEVFFDFTECSGHGMRMRTGRCNCFLGFSGSQCEFGENECLHQCGGHGYCNEKSQCVCERSYAGLFCDKIVRCPSGDAQLRDNASGDDCCGRGYCVPRYGIDARLVKGSRPSSSSSSTPVQQGECLCEAGYAGGSCKVTETLAYDLFIEASIAVEAIEAIEKEALIETASGKKPQSAIAKLLTTDEKLVLDRLQRLLRVKDDTNNPLIDDFFDGNCFETSLRPFGIPSADELNDRRLNEHVQGDPTLGMLPSYLITGETFEKQTLNPEAALLREQETGAERAAAAPLLGELQPQSEGGPAYDLLRGQQPGTATISNQDLQSIFGRTQLLALRIVCAIVSLSSLYLVAAHGRARRHATATLPVRARSSEEGLALTSNPA